MAKDLEQRFASAFGIQIDRPIDRSVILNDATRLVSDAWNSAAAKDKGLATAAEAAIGAYRSACNYLLGRFHDPEDANAATFALAGITLTAMFAGSKEPSHLERWFKLAQSVQRQNLAASGRAAKASKNLDKLTIRGIVDEKWEVAKREPGGKHKIQIAERAWEATNDALATAREKRGLPPLDGPHFKNADTLRRAYIRLQKGIAT